MESDLLELSRSHLGECRHCRQHIFGKASESAEMKIDAAEVGIISQVKGEVL
jgi:predicted anti-sigma-YlaC factor YlaD